MNKNTVQRIFQLMGWQVRKRVASMRPRIKVASAPDKRWATDLCQVWGGRDGWLGLPLVMDCHTHERLSGIYLVLARRIPQRLRWSRR